jgi:hypothetical protein
VHSYALQNLRTHYKKNESTGLKTPTECEDSNFQKYLKTAWVDEVYEMIAAKVKDRGPKITWEIVGIYRAPNEDKRLLEKLADRTGYVGSIIAEDLNLPYAD